MVNHKAVLHNCIEKGEAYTKGNKTKKIIILVVLAIILLIILIIASKIKTVFCNDILPRILLDKQLAYVEETYNDYILDDFATINTEINDIVASNAYEATYLTNNILYGMYKTHGNPIIIEFTLYSDNDLISGAEFRYCFVFTDEIDDVVKEPTKIHAVSLQPQNNKASYIKANMLNDNIGTD